MLERAKEVTRNGKYTYVEYARFADVDGCGDPYFSGVEAW
jgi:hypothetical protein